eukprot:symbB.v1.2.032174.t1/scaffold3823.1/size51816/1
MAEYSELLAWLLSPFQTKDPEKSLRRHQDRLGTDAMGRCLGWCLLLSLNFQAVQGQGQTVPCIDDCLAEALASVPTKGCAAGTLWQPHPLSAPVDSCQPCPPGSYCPGIPYGNFTEHPINLNRPVLCPRGTFRSISGAMSISDCDPCLPGRF